MNMRCVCSLVCHRPQCECVGDSGHSRHYLLSPCHTPAFSNTLAMLRLPQPHKYLYRQCRGEIEECCIIVSQNRIIKPTRFVGHKKNDGVDPQVVFRSRGTFSTIRDGGMQHCHSTHFQWKLTRELRNPVKVL